MSMKNKKSSKKYTHIKKEERLEIAILLKKGYSPKNIADVLKRSPNTISQELNRNSVNGIYDPIKANLKSYTKRKYSKFQIMKIVKDKELWDYIKDKLKNDWSPELISGRLKKENKLKNISKNSIYKFIKNRYLEEYLKLKGRRRKKGRKKAKQLENRVFIDKRSKNIDNRRHYGHWEGDFIVSGRKGKSCLLVLYGRKSRYRILKSYR